MNGRWITEKAVVVAEKTNYTDEVGNLGINLKVENDGSEYFGVAYLFLPNADYGEIDNVAEVCEGTGNTLEKTKEELIYNLFTSLGDDLALLGSKLNYEVKLSIERG